MHPLTKKLLLLLATARALGLNEADLENARDYLKHNEQGLCFDTILTQLYEYNIEIDNDLYETIVEIGKAINLEPDAYSFMKELIKGGTGSP